MSIQYTAINYWQLASAEYQAGSRHPVHLLTQSSVQCTSVPKKSEFSIGEIRLRIRTRESRGVKVLDIYMAIL